MTDPIAAQPGLVTRTAWLMLGAAIGLAAVLLAVTLATTVADLIGVPSPLLVAVFLLPVPLLALVPGVRELEHTAARTMLRADVELVAGPVRADHRWRMIGWVTLHLLGGLLAAFLLLGLVTGAVTVAIWTVAGAEEMLRRVAMPSPDGAGARGWVVLACAGVCAGCLLAVWGIGLALRQLVPVLLGPTWRDRLQVAEHRLATEVEHTLLARELHDGIGHALTLINIQAVAGRRVLDRDPASAGVSLLAIESAARTALAELDTMLGVLRDGPADRVPEHDLHQLDRLLTIHRENGLDLVADIASVDGLAPLVSRSAYRIVSEALTNAHRHAGPGQIRLSVTREPDAVRIQVTNPRRPGASGRGRDGGGRGLIGMTERLRLFGGTLQTGPRDDHWVLDATLPTGESRG